MRKKQHQREVDSQLGGLVSERKKDKQVKNSSHSQQETENRPKMITIDIENYTVSEKTITLKSESEKFQFTNPAYFHPDNNVKEVAQKCFDWVFNPINFTKFTESYMNKKILILKRNGSQFRYNFDAQANCLFSWPMVKQYLRANDGILEYGQDLDVVKYIKHRRATINPSRSFNFNLTMDLYHKFNASIRILRPHQISDNLIKVITLFEELFVASGGANAYLTPKPTENRIQDSESESDQQEKRPTQGFAPHYDDVDTFILQIEGAKFWKLHKSPSSSEVLAINPSKDFNPNVDLPQLIWEGMLQEGDLLYMPRGIVHHANTVEGNHSIHVTISNQHHTSWGEMIKAALAKMMDKLLQSPNQQFRKSIPPAFLESTQSQEFQKLALKVKEQISGTSFLKLSKEHLAQSFQHCRLNPLELIKEPEVQNPEIGEGLKEQRNQDQQDQDFESVKLLSLHAASLVGRKLFYSTENTKIYQEVESKFLELDKKWKRESVEHIRRAYPNYLSAEELKKKVECSETDLLHFLKDLADRHILIVQ